MIKTLIKTYHTVFTKGQLAVIEAFSKEENFFRNEVAFFDNGRVASGIEALKKDYADLQTEIEFVKKNRINDKDYNDRINFLYSRQYECMMTIVFQASQNLQNIDSCLDILGDSNNVFKLCLEGLNFYKHTKKDDAFAKLTEYLKIKKSFDEHYLLNKIYGEMLYDKGLYKEAKLFLYIVTQICPEDDMAHQLLKAIYAKDGDTVGVAVEEEIISVLGDRT